MSSKVYFSSLSGKSRVSPLTKITKLLNRCGAKDIYAKDDLVAIKVHFGELGNTAFIRPIFLRPVVELLNQKNAKPFLTDTNTLYAGMRNNSVSHLHNANWNGFGYSTLQVPVIIADGLRGENSIDVPVEGTELIDKARLATDIVNADALLVVSHFKGHEAAGFGGAIKNLSMGCASRAGKLAMHSSSKPSVKQDKCTACGLCTTVCHWKAIKIENKAADITELCTGCARCVGICPHRAIYVKYDASFTNMQKMMAEYAKAVVASSRKPVVFLNILTAISPTCDCAPGNDAPVTHDIGFMSSLDPVALDKAGLDMVLKQCEGIDPFAAKNGGITGDVQLTHAEKIGLGSLDYELVEVN